MVLVLGLHDSEPLYASCSRQRLPSKSSDDAATIAGCHTTDMLLQFTHTTHRK